jgi:hypothetical protein
MSTEPRNPEALQPPQVAETLNGREPTPEQRALQDARRAADHAVMAIFELAFSLESLSEVIARFEAETSRQRA